MEKIPKEKIIPNSVTRQPPGDGPTKCAGTGSDGFGLFACSDYADRCQTLVFIFC